MIWLLIMILLNPRVNVKGLKIESPYIRPADREMTSALYFQVVNQSDESDTLYGVRADFCETAQIHESYVKDGMMAMRQVKWVVIPGKSTFKFKPGGYHIMLINIKRKLIIGAKVSVELLFKRTGKILLTAEVHD